MYEKYQNKMKGSCDLVIHWDSLSVKETKKLYLYVSLNKCLNTDSKTGEMKIKAIITGATGMVGEGVLNECLLILMWKRYWL